jgi:hypothetical protein
MLHRKQRRIAGRRLRRHWLRRASPTGLECHQRAVQRLNAQESHLCECVCMYVRIFVRGCVHMWVYICLCGVKIMLCVWTEKLVIPKYLRKRCYFVCRCRPPSNHVWDAVFTKRGCVHYRELCLPISFSYLSLSPLVHVWLVIISISIYYLSLYPRFHFYLSTNPTPPCGQWLAVVPAANTVVWFL